MTGGGNAYGSPFSLVRYIRRRASVPGTRDQRPTIDPANEVTMENRSRVSHNLIGQFKVTVVP